MEPLRSQKITTLHSNYTQEQKAKHQEIKKKRLGLYRRLVIMGVFALFVSYGIGSVLFAQTKFAEQKMNEKYELEKEYARLKELEKDHRLEIVKLNDDEYVAKLARNEYFLSEEGEIIFKLPEE